MKDLAYQALLMEFQNPLLGFEGIETDRAPSIPDPRQTFAASVPTISPFEPTMRQRLGSGAQRGLEFFGMRRPQARSVSQAIFGGPSSPMPANLGIADVVPFLGTALQTEEAVGSLGRAGQLAGQGEYGQAALEAGAGVLGLVPGAVGTVQVARPIARQMRAEPPVGAITPIQMAREMAPRSPIGFYSAVEETVANIPQTKGTGDQFLAQIQKTPGVKPDEIQWTGLDEFLKGKKSVTKDDIQNYLKANRVDVQEVRLGEMSPEQSMAKDQAINRYIEITDAVADTRQKVEEGLLSSQEARAILEPLNAERSNLDRTINRINTSINTKFSKYTLPGGKNYREILLTLPEANVARQAKIDAINEQYNAVLAGRAIADLPPSEKAVIDRLTKEHNAIADAPIGQDYRSSHFDQPNILAHMRVNDRVVDGKNTLFIEEIQSDWHQAGRKKGYQRAKDLTPEEIDLRFVQSEVPPGADPSVYPGYYEAFEKSTGQFLGRHSGTLNREQAMRDAVMSANQFQTGVPNAPFKTTWHELSLKRAIQEASEKGYDQIAFTTGKTQAARYDLSKQVDAINYRKNKDGTFSLGVKGKNQIVFEDNIGGTSLQNIPESELSSVVGKDLAEKIIAGEGRKAGQTPTRIFEGLDLSVGGKGMEGFYDNILPKSLEKLGKKFGAKVGKTEMDGVEVWQMDITPKMRESAKSKGQPLFQVLPPAAAVGAMQGEEETQ